jgi:hypothetical protein
MGGSSDNSSLPFGWELISSWGRLIVIAKKLLLLALG